MATFDRLSAMQNRSVEFGINGLGGVHWPGTFSHEAPPARKSAFWFERTSTDWSEEAKVKFLTEMYDALLDIFSLPAAAPGVVFARSEEHTSELQSLMRISSAVFCLKKKP